ncbi:hypothetical protein EMIHUDRAFT_366902 [Emiliania huxleyi CCMP1516]|uniref:Uncharacterized protein n=2 Tax=Emiliania huxleyi TaxID=2903 RepID=A0A0D3JTA4_EMIH1|nr:hypothetical protein EMIHUDRAFT_366902 [Emiliania huxleyi CCMP1516]EOD26739.1 hypothetical protein EMIHUDRAFT_366902 [Emiliania huxleyi CCMP1516]|eukprot:XP_005779168.1 hypothetical protein EMIHUDRAFT_366902 [Emiliania huxleyi CCMP1516]
MRPASDLPSLSQRLERQNSLPAADPSSLTDDPAVDPGPKLGRDAASTAESASCAGVVVDRDDEESAAGHALAV